MKATETNLNRFLAQNDTQFVIPVYQRNYDWTLAHCKQLVDDILFAGCERNITSHFIGSVVFIHDDVYSSTGVRELTIIDGQQRITTVTLIYILLYKIALRNDNEQLVSRIHETYLINKFIESEKLKLRPTENNDNALKFLINNNDEKISFPEYSRLVENFDYLATRINEHNIEFIQKGLDKLMFVEISLERDKDDPQRIFESLNSTGLDLSQADLIRNYILMGLKPQHQRKIYDNYWQPIEKLCTVSETNENRVSDFIRDFLTIENRDIPDKSKVYLEFKNKYTFGSDIELLEKILSKIRNYANYYCKLINPEIETDLDIRRQIYYINKLEINVSYPFVLEVFKDFDNNVISKETFIQVLELIQSFVWRRFVVGLPTNALNKIFMRLYEDVDSSDYLASIQKSLIKKKSTQRFPKNSEIIEIIKEKDFYGIQSRNRMYLLERLENFENKEYVQIDGNHDITVEHIFPQTPDSKWKYDLGEEQFDEFKEKYLNTLANLTLSGNNGSLGNKPFIAKRDLPEKGYRDSRLFLNKYLSTLEKWDLKELKSRREMLTKRFLRIWKYPSVVVDSENDNEEINILEADEPTHKKLDYVIFFEQKQKISKVSELYLNVISFLFSEQPQMFFTSDLGEKVGLTKDKNIPRQAMSINETYFIEANLDSKGKFDRIKYALTKAGITDELFIKYANN
jgi:uncharacterized protein with ParB-like and HNH nuclease domain